METELLKRLTEYLNNTPVEQQLKDWQEVKNLNLVGGLSVSEFIKKFKYSSARINGELATDE